MSGLQKFIEVGSYGEGPTRAAYVVNPQIARRRMAASGA